MPSPRHRPSVSKHYVARGGEGYPALCGATVSEVHYQYIINRNPEEYKPGTVYTPYSWVHVDHVNVVVLCPKCNDLALLEQLKGVVL
jgi:hypothetical protein